MQIYIAGPMRGIENNNFSNFFRIEKELNGKYLNATIINPAKISVSLSELYNKKINEIDLTVYMREDIKLLIECTHIYMMEGWRKSKYATLEFNVAKAIGLKTLFEN